MVGPLGNKNESTSSFDFAFDLKRQRRALYQHGEKPHVHEAKEFQGLKARPIFAPALSSLLTYALALPAPCLSPLDHDSAFVVQTIVL